MLLSIPRVRVFFDGVVDFRLNNKLLQVYKTDK